MILQVLELLLEQINQAHTTQRRKEQVCTTTPAYEEVGCHIGFRWCHMLSAGNSLHVLLHMGIIHQLQRRWVW
jgi:hypothetical protein